MTVAAARAFDGEALCRLRAATQEAHRRLENRLDVVEALACPFQRPALVARYRRFHDGAAVLLRPWPMPAAASWLDERASGGRGFERAQGEPRPDALIPRDAAEAAGFRYVIEGSALGGRVILKALGARGVDVAGLEFLDPWGGRAGAGWRALVAALERVLDTDEARRAGVAGAGKGFGFAELMLCGAEPLPREPAMLEAAA